MMNDMTVPESPRTTAIEVATDRTAAEVVRHVNLMREVASRVMKKGVHFGTVPGVDKPTLLKPGAEVLAVTFRLSPSYTHETRYAADGHLDVLTVCTLTHQVTVQVIATGAAICTSRETKYAYRKATRRCPKCGKECIIRGKEEYGGGWLCWAKKGGCGAKFDAGDKSIEDQKEERLPNENLADTYNTILKMSAKRALVAAILNATGASSEFTQDVEDFAPLVEDAEPATKPPSGPPPNWSPPAKSVFAPPETPKVVTPEVVPPATPPKEGRLLVQIGSVKVGWSGEKRRKDNTPYTATRYDITVSDADGERVLETWDDDIADKARSCHEKLAAVVVESKASKDGKFVNHILRALDPV